MDTLRYKEIVCSDCPVVFTPSGARQKRCSSCGKVANEKRVLAERRFRNHRRHGLTDSEFEEMCLRGCDICHQPFQSTPHIDHDHEHCDKQYGCGECVRGILCNFCNNGFIYAVEKNPALRLLVSPEVAAYIDQHRHTPETSS